MSSFYGKKYNILLNRECQRYLVVDKINRIAETYIIYESFFRDSPKVWRLLFNPDKEVGLAKEFDEVWNFINKLQIKYPKGWR